MAFLPQTRFSKGIDGHFSELQFCVGVELPLNFLSVQKPKFPRETAQVAFYRTLRQRVNDYMKSEGASRYANSNMVIKTILMFALYLVPLGLLLSGAFVAGWQVFLLYVVMGLGMAGIGLNVMHDANHGAFSRSKWLNNALGASMNLIGSSAFVWKLQHNVLHHSYTNVDGADEDISIPFLFRFSPNQPRYWFHRFQHWYAWFFYGLMTLYRTFFSDYNKLVAYRKQGLIPDKKAYRREWIKLVAWKSGYYLATLILPLVLLPTATWVVLLSFFVMHFMTGITLAFVFQTAHVMPTSEFPLPDDEGKMEQSWAIHELVTTTNFAPRSRVLSWLIGGLNFQIEHHLFANICHVHYPKLSPIVARTAQEFGLPYYTQPTFAHAIVAHLRMLKQLGRG